MLITDETIGHRLVLRRVVKEERRPVATILIKDETIGHRLLLRRVVKEETGIYECIGISYI